MSFKKNLYKNRLYIVSGGLAVGAVYALFNESLPEKVLTVSLNLWVVALIGFAFYVFYTFYYTLPRKWARLKLSPVQKEKTPVRVVGVEEQQPSEQSKEKEMLVIKEPPTLPKGKRKIQYPEKTPSEDPIMKSLLQEEPTPFDDLELKDKEKEKKEEKPEVKK